MIEEYNRNYRCKNKKLKTASIIEVRALLKSVFATSLAL
jgi:hypothetical protein